MRKKIFIPIPALIAALLLALVATMTPFIAENNTVYAQEVVTANTDSSLSNLTLSVGKLDRSLNLSDPSVGYEASVPNRTNRVRVTATPNIQGAQVTIKYSTTADAFEAGTGSLIADVGTIASGGSVPLIVGDTEIGIEVKALDYDADDVDNDDLVSVYTVTVTRIESDVSKVATLSAFAPEQGVTVSPSVFDPDVTSYTALVANATPSVTVTVTATDAAGATVELTSDKDSTIGDDNVVMLSVGVNVITAKVTAADLVTTKTYTLRVTKAAANASDDARLRSLSLSGITLSETFELDRAPTGTPSAVRYSANVPYRTEQTTVTFAVNNPGAIATVESPNDFNPLVAGHQVFLGVGVNTITIEVTAENAGPSKPYIVTVNRASVNASDNADLITADLNSGLVIGNGTGTGTNVTMSPTLSPGFDKDVTSYTALVSNDTTGLTVTARAHATAAPPVVTSNKGSDKVAANSTTGANIATHVVTLDEGANVIAIKVTAANLVATKTYTLTVTRAATNASDDARLGSLRVGGESVSVSGKGTLSTVAVPTAADYMTGVGNGVSSIAISATLNHSGAMMSIFSAGSAATFSHATGNVDADGLIDLSIGRNNVRIEVTAENGFTVRNYFLVINRAAAGASNNADLLSTASDSGLMISAGTLSPSFGKDVTSYTALVPSGTEELTVTARAYAGEEVGGVTINAARPVVTSNKGANKVAADANANAAVNVATHVVTLDEGVNVITIKVTAADLVTTKTYTLDGDAPRGERFG